MYDFSKILENRYGGTETLNSFRQCTFTDLKQLNGLLFIVILQLPLLLGVPILEKLVPPLAPLFIGRTGRQLFLTDGKPSKPPLLLRMASNCEDGKFM